MVVRHRRPAHRRRLLLRLAQPHHNDPGRRHPQRGVLERRDVGLLQHRRHLDDHPGQHHHQLHPRRRRTPRGVDQCHGWHDDETVTRHYTDASDNPGWVTDVIGSTSTTTRYAESIGGDLAATITDNGTTTSVNLPVVDPHGDVVAGIDIPSSGDPAGITAWIDTDEYGNPLSTGCRGAPPPLRPASATDGSAGNNAPPPTPASSSWEPASTTPSPEHFTSLDPVFGRQSHRVRVSPRPHRKLRPHRSMGIQLQLVGSVVPTRWITPLVGRVPDVQGAAVPAYGLYYAGYRWNRWSGSRFVPLGHQAGWIMQAAGLAGDAYIDVRKRNTGLAGHESIWDEHAFGHLNPFHGSGRGHTWLPGLWKDGRGHRHVDWAW